MWDHSAGSDNLLGAFPSLLSLFPPLTQMASLEPHQPENRHKLMMSACILAGECRFGLAALVPCAGQSVSQELAIKPALGRRAFGNACGTLTLRMSYIAAADMARHKAKAWDALTETLTSDTHWEIHLARAASPRQDVVFAKSEESVGSTDTEKPIFKNEGSAAVSSRGAGRSTWADHLVFDQEKGDASSKGPAASPKKKHHEGHAKSSGDAKHSASPSTAGGEGQFASRDEAQAGWRDVGSTLFTPKKAPGVAGAMNAATPLISYSQRKGPRYGVPSRRGS